MDRLSRTNSTEEIHKQFDEDMQAYGNEKKPEPEPTRRRQTSSDAGTLYYTACRKHAQGYPGPYRRAVRSRALVADLETRFKSREAAKDEAIETLNASYTNMKVM